MKRLIICLLVLAMALCAVSCEKRTAKNSPEEVFAITDMSITLSSAFEQAKNNDYTACFEASDVTVYVIREEFKDLTEEQASISLASYAELVRANNISKNPSEITETESGLTTFDYSYQDPFTGDVTKTFCALYRTANSFWTIQFCCDETVYAEYVPVFDDWAKSVSFVLKDMDYVIEDKIFISMAEGFVEKDLAEFNDNNRITRAKTEQMISTYASDDGSIILNVKRESQSDVGVKKIKDYAELVHERYTMQAKLNKSIKNISSLQKKSNVRYFEFGFNQTAANGMTTPYKYFVFCVDGDKEFFTIEIACPDKQYDGNFDNFLKWAKTATTDLDD
ncbi:MAG: hypothetical protein IJW16_04240 [Clostridia bacterium]|nr:hypothetical protein [Clostridia bacterium]